MRKTVLRIQLLLVFSCVTLICTAQPIQDVFFGMHNADFAIKPQQIRFSTLRLWDSGVCWNQLETEQGSWNFERFDRLISEAQSKNIELIYVLGQTPTWATSNPLDSTGVYGIGANHIPKHIDFWENYIRIVAQRYKGKIRYYEVWNEPNFPIFFNGTIEQMSDLTRSTYKILKGIDPQIQLISPGVIAGAFDWLPQKNSGTEWIKTYLEITPIENFDIIGAHFYTAEKESPEQELIPLIRKFKETLQLFNIEKPVWNTEQGYGAMDPKKRRNYSGDTAIGIAVRTYLINLMEGIERVYWYNWSNREFCSLYMVEEDHITPTEAAKAVTFIRDNLVGKTVIKTKSIDESTFIIHLKNEKNNRFAIAWSASEKQISQLDFDQILSIKSANSKSITFNEEGFRIGQIPVFIQFK